jgi:prevent-host-death family protein
MAAVKTVDARAQFAELVNRAAYGHERITLMRRGKGVAAIVPLEDLELLEMLEDQIDLREAEKALKEEGSIPWEKVRKQLGI